MSTVALPSEKWGSYLKPSVPTHRPTRVKNDTLLLVNSNAANNPRLALLHSRIDSISTLPKNWDGHGSAKPNSNAIERARQLLEDVYSFTKATDAGWRNPHISASEEGEIVFEWESGVRQLTVYIGPSDSMYLKSWGPHIENDMEDGKLPHGWEPSLWAWLNYLNE